MKSSDHDKGRGEELWLLALALCAIAGSFILQPAGCGGLSLPIPFLSEPVALPEMCMSRRILGVSCPGCGLTRSFVATARGDLSTAFKWNPMGPVLFLVVLFQIPYRLIQYLGIWKCHPLWVRTTQGLAVAIWPISAGLIVSWLVRTL